MKSHRSDGRKFVEKLLAFFVAEDALAETGHVVEQVAEQLLELMGFLDTGEVDQIFKKLTDTAKEMHVRKAFVSERDYLELAMRFARKRPKIADLADLASLLALSSMNEAEWHSETTHSWVQAAKNTGKAIQRLRKYHIPNGVAWVLMSG